MKKPGNAAHAMLATAAALLLEQILPVIIGTGGREFARICAAQLAVTVFCLGIWPILLKVRKWPAPETGKKNRVGMLFVSAGLGIGMQFGLAFLTEHWISLLGLEREGSVPLPVSAGEWAVAVLVLAILPAVAEEWFFRGMIYRGMTEIMTPFAASLVATVLFAAAHRSINALPAMLIFGTIASMLVRLGGKMRYGIIFHLCYNVTALVLMAV